MLEILPPSCWAGGSDILHLVETFYIYLYSLLRVCLRDYTFLKDLPHNVSSMVTSMSYPTFIDPMSGDANFNSIGQFPYLFWVSIGHSPETDGRHLWATPFSFT